MFTTDIYTVSQLTRYIKDLLDGDFALRDLWLEGEVSNFVRAASGHVYFTLKDKSSQIRCVMWRSQVPFQRRLPQSGEAVVCHGYVSIYEAQGAYQFYVDLIQPAGAGALHLQFEALKNKLQAEGLFDAGRKRPLPRYPQRLGVVTSPVGAALRDILHVLERRYPLVHVVISPTVVQGDEAPPQIVEAVRALNVAGGADAIIVARGGGSLEDLWAFNDERVARAIAASSVPVITGVGHETDFTIADFVADVRAPTPSAAAEMAVPDRGELQARLRTIEGRLCRLMGERLERERLRLAQGRMSLARFSPQAQIANLRQRVDDLSSATLSHLRHRLTVQREQLRSRTLQLQSLSPFTTLERGYSITTHVQSGKIVKSVGQVSAGDAIEVQVTDGRFRGTVT